MFYLHFRETELAGENAKVLLQDLSESIETTREEAMYETAQPENVTGQMPKTTLSGYDLVGIVCVPSVNVELPVLNTWSYDLLKIAPCRYSGSLESRDLILLGHNYVTHFAPLRKVQVGAKVEFCDVRGTVHRFTVSETEVLKDTELDRLTSSAYPLTIFTCTRSGASRFVLRCDYA